MSRVIEGYGTGIFFPADAAVLREKVRWLLQAATPPPCRPKAIIVPHAGYDYSGPVAATGYACVAQQAATIRRVILLGTCHAVRTSSLLTTTAAAFCTPLGNVPVDKAAVGQAAGLPSVAYDDAAHEFDHALAVQLPMLQMTLAEFRVAPFLVGACSATEVGELLEVLWDGNETLVVVSSDLSHHLTCDEACRRDEQTADAIERLDAEAIGPEDACGRRAIAGLLMAAQRHNLRARRVEMRNSGDMSGCRDRVVGYGAFVLEPEGYS